VAHLEVSFTDNFKVAGGLFASVQKGSSFRFDQAPVGAELWLPTGAEAAIQARLLLVKGIRQHFTSATTTSSNFTWLRNRKERQHYARSKQ